MAKEKADMHHRMMGLALFPTGCIGCRHPE